MRVETREPADTDVRARLDPELEAGRTGYGVRLIVELAEEVWAS